MMEFNYFDIIVAAVILLLGIKGIFNGFFREFFGLVGIIGGIFVASRVGDSVGAYLSDMIFKFHNQASISFTGFLVTLIAFWIVMIIAGTLFRKLSSLSGLGVIDKIFGFIFASGKFFLIASVIAYAAYNIKAIKSSIDSSFSKHKSILLPILVETGGYIMKMDPSELSPSVSQETKNKIKSSVENSTKQISETIKKQVNSIKENMSN